MLKVEFDHDAFLKEIDPLCRKGIDFSDAILLYCENNNIEIELIAGIIKKNPEYRARMTIEARRKNLLVKE